MREPPEPPSAQNPQLDPALDQVVLTALAKDPAQRYQRAVELHHGLQRILAGEATAAEPTEPLLAPLGRTGTGATPTATGPAAGRTQEPGHRHAVPRLEAASDAELPPGWPSVLRADHRHSHFV